MPSEFSTRAIQIIKGIPEGTVATYGQIAALAGSPRAARQVAWLLHSASDKYDLPWHRVINAQGRISLRANQGHKRQKRRLKSENIKINQKGQVNLSRYQWQPQGMAFL